MLKKQYDIENKVLGVGSFGKVLLAKGKTESPIKILTLKKQVSYDMYAIKVMEKQLLGSNIENFKEVCQVLKS